MMNIKLLKNALILGTLLAQTASYTAPAQPTFIGAPIDGPPVNIPNVTVAQQTPLSNALPDAPLSVPEPPPVEKGKLPMEEMPTDTEQTQQSTEEEEVFDETHIMQEMPEAEKEEPADIYLNFENATLSSIVNYLSEQREFNIVPHKNLDGIRVSLTTREPMTLTRAWNVLLTLLDMNGYSILNVNDLFRIVPIRQAQQEPLPFYSSTQGVDPEDLPDTDEVIRYAYFFQNARAQQMQQILARMLIENSVKINPDLEAVIITEKSNSIKSAMKIVKELDVGGLRESIKIIRLQYADAEQLAKLFQTIIGDKKEEGNIRFITADQSKERSYFSKTTKIIPDPIKNTLILLGTEENMNRIITFIQTHLDKEPEAADSRLHIKEIKYASAAKLKPILDSIIRAPAGQKKEKTALVGKFKFFEDVIIAAETPSNDPGSLRGSGNRLIVAANKDDWRRLEKFIDELDKPEPQVAMEVMIVDVSTRLNRDLGAQIRSKNGWLGRGVCGEAVHLVAESFSPNRDICDNNLIGVAAAAGVPATVVTLGDAKKNDIWGVVRSILGTESANVISQPFLVANSGEESTINVSEVRRVAGRINDPSKAGGARTQDVEDYPASSKITLQPRINKQGVVSLSVEVEISSFQEATTADQPATSERRLVTQATMGTGEVLVLGGLMRSERREVRHKTPILGDIPIIGNLFRQKRKESNKTNLYVFIRPSVIKPIFEGKPDDYTELKLAYAKYQILGSDSYLKNRDPIQRWFFKPRKASIKQNLADLAEGRFRALDDFTQGKEHPKSVNIARDPFYKTETELKKMKKAEESKKKRIALAMMKQRKKKKVVRPEEMSQGLNALHTFAMSKK